MPPINTSLSSSPSVEELDLQQHAPAFSPTTTVTNETVVGDAMSEHHLMVSTASSAPAKGLEHHHQQQQQQQGAEPAPATLAAAASSTGHSTTWEEPHPGQRLSYPFDEAAAFGGANNNRMCGSGITAKDRQYGPYHARGRGLSRRVARNPKLRISSLKPFKIPNNALQEHQALYSAPSLPLHRNYSNTITAVHSDGEKADRALHYESPTEPPIEVDPDLGKDIDMDDALPTPIEKGLDTPPHTTPTATPGSETSYPGSMYFSDFSNHLNIDYGHTEEQQPPEVYGPVSVFDSDSYSPAVPGSDMYGWDAELERQCGMGLASESQCYPHLKYQRANGQKKSLLYRVFSFTPSVQEREI